MKSIIIMAISAFMFLMNVPGNAQDIRLIVPFAAGGTTDVIARIVAQEISKNENISVVVENRPGALGSIGANYVINSRSRGQVLLFSSNGIIANRMFSDNPNVDIIGRLAPVASIIESAMVMMVPSDFPATNGREFVSLIRSRPNFYHYGTSAGGGTLQLAATLFMNSSGLNMVPVPYGGGSSAATDLMAGRISLMFDSNIIGMRHHNAGTLRAIAVTSGTRSRNAPNIPTWREIGINTEFVAWQGIYASRDTSSEILRSLNEIINRTIKTKETTDRLLQMGADSILAESLEQLERRIANELRMINTL